MNSNLLSNLNSAQQNAVTFSRGNLLVLAGAGSGKTRVLVHRIAWLLQNGTAAQNIIAVTFTNKAAMEMRERLEQMLQTPLSNMWVGTFHGLAHRMLRLHWQEAGLPQAFQILDADDQTRIIKRIHKAFNLDLEKWPIKRLQGFINNNKEQGIRANKLETNVFAEAILVKVYQAYEEACNRSGLVDFAELLLRSYELLRDNQNLRKHYQTRFHHVLVDEFQDTNKIQYAFVKLLTHTNSKLTAVGDDDQSIYSWRGADSANMQRLSDDYPDIATIRLEQNYRSTSIILNAANAVISRNNNRLGKELWTEQKDGEPITLYAAFNETDEARYIVGKIHDWLNQSKKISDIAILYRSNAQSRVIEEQLLQNGISYRIYGGLRFFERAEIKDTLAYLRLICNRNDDAALERIINLPARGIGEATLVSLRDHAKNNNCSLWQSIQMMLETKQLNARTANALQSFTQLINSSSLAITNYDLPEIIRFIINVTNLRTHYAKDPHERGQSRLENLDELINASDQFAKTNPDTEQNSLLTMFLAHTTLEAGEHVNSSTECVQLMTLHAAKGLEFPLVFLCGMEDGLFPHIMSMGTTNELEEERRLCYVGMTRAMQKLYLLYAESRLLHGTTTFRRASRFLSEIPQNLIVSDSILNIAKPATFNTSYNNTSHNKKTFSTPQNSAEINGFRLGQIIAHKTFGAGTIIGFEGQGESMLVQISFKKVGNKWLSPKYASLKTSD